MCDLPHPPDSLSNGVLENPDCQLSDKDLLDALMVAMPDKIYFKDREGRFLKISSKMAMEFQIKDSSEAIGRTDFDFFSEEHAAQAFKDEQHIIATGEPLLSMEEKETWPDGSVSWGSTTKIPMRAKNGDIVGIIGITRDITERKKAQESLQKAELKMVESEKMALLGHLIAGVAHEINTPLGAIGAAVGNISSTLDENLPGLPSFFQGLPDEFQNSFLRLVRRSTFPSAHLSAKEERAFRNTLRSMLSDKGIPNAPRTAEVLVMMGISSDLDEFLPMLSHPEGGACLEMAYKLSGLGRSATIITTAAERAGKIVFALKNYAHFDRSGECIKADIAEGIETVLTLYHNQLKRGITVKREYVDIPNILCRPDELNQVWTNLIHNAIHAMNSHGDLTISVGPCENGVKISFADSGTGVPPELREKIFEPFFTTKSAGEGSGLGLHIVKQIIEDHGGTITLLDQAGGGAIFEVILPAS